MHPEAMAWCAMWGHAGPGRGLDVGGQEINGNARGYWPGLTWDVVDREPFPAPPNTRTIVADARTYEPEHAYDVVLSTELLEHVAGWPDCVRTMVKALAPGGLLVITCAGPGRAPHPMNGHAWEIDEPYGNVEPGELVDVMTGLGVRQVVVDYEPSSCDTRVVASSASPGANSVAWVGGPLVLVPTHRPEVVSRS